MCSEATGEPQTPRDKLSPALAWEPQSYLVPTRAAGGVAEARVPGCLIAARPGDAVEAFAWYNRPLQHSPGILP